MAQVLDPSLAERAQSALDKHAWREAFDLLAEADADGGLSAEELELYARAAWWVGQLPVSIEARERAYAAYEKAGDTVMAAAAAIELAHDNLNKLAYTVGSGWLNRAERLLQGMEENPAHGWLAVTRAHQLSIMGDIEESIAQAKRGHEIGTRLGDRDLEALSLTIEGAGLVHKGDVDEGLAILDEAAVASLAGDLQPDVAGGISCVAIGACSLLGDWRRASDWTAAQDRWCQREQISGYPGMCRLHRAEIKRMHGSWLEAEAEARQAGEELQGYIPAAVGLALYQVGEIRLLRGDLPAAEEALLRAHSFGRDPEPALSLVRLAEGNAEAAGASIKRALDEPSEEPSWWAPPGSNVYRLPLLPAQVQIALAAGDTATARAAADELTTLAESFKSLTVRANAAMSQGAVLIAEGDQAGGVQALRRAVQLWNELEAPYETARTRMLLGQAYAAEGAGDRALLEIRAARTSFEHLGATPDLRRADETLAALEGAGPGPSARTGAQRAAKAFVFTDIVDSTKLAELLGDEAWDKLIRWHDQTLRTLVAQHGGEEIKGTGDGFFLAFGDPDGAIECAIATQRRLDEHRHAQGFAPAVRIGVHWAEANKTGLDYFGTGVNQAARVGGHAGGGEILVSAPTLQRARRTFAESGRQTVELKGIAEPVEVVSINWR
jgi:class 3 adenylate cyclase